MKFLTDVGVLMEESKRKFQNIFNLNRVPVALLVNNVIAVGSHIAITFLVFQILASFPSEGTLSFLTFLFLVLLSLGLYVASGWLLKPVPDFNLLSVMALLFLIGMIYGAPDTLAAYLPLSREFFDTVLFNNPLFGAATALIAVLGVNNNAFLFFLPLIAAVFSPPLFIYVGVCMKMKKQEKGGNAITENEES